MARLLLGVAAACMLAVEMPAPVHVSARLHEQPQFVRDDPGSMHAEHSIEQQQQQQQQQQNHRRLQEMKTEWPECIGMQAEACATLIESEASDAYTLIVRPNDFNFHRVMIRVDGDNLVTKVPSRG
jgi:hypothetical protein